MWLCINDEGRNYYWWRNTRNIKKKQLEISIDKFLNPFESIFFNIGIIFESYDTQITEPYNEQDMINKYKNLNFNEIESFLKLYEDGELE